MLPFIMLIGLGLLWAVGRIYRPGVGRPRGRRSETIWLPLLGRLRLHAAPAALLTMVTLAGVAIGQLPLLSIPLVLAVLALLIALPVAYTLTDQGIMLGRTRFRRWTEFAGLVRRPGGARLQGVAGNRGMRIWLSASRGDDEFVLLLRRMIKNAYQGRSNARDEPVADSSGPAEPPVIAAYSESG